MSNFGFYVASSGPNPPGTGTNNNDRVYSNPFNNPASYNNSASSSNPASLNNPTVNSLNPSQGKRYFCSHPKHGNNNTHNTEDCRRIKQEEQRSNGWRNIMFSMAKQHVVKVDKLRKSKQDNRLVNYSNLELKLEAEELKKKLEDVKQEMKLRGIR